MEKQRVKSCGHISIVLGLCAVLTACAKKESAEQTIGIPEPAPPAPTKALKKAATAAEFEAYIKQGFTRLSQADNSSGAYSGLAVNTAITLDRGTLPTVQTALPTASGGAASAPVSTTNRVDNNVDETDTVKTDGQYLYVLETQPQRYYLTALPVRAVADAAPTSALIAPLPPQPAPQAHKIRILKRATQNPGITPITEITLSTNIVSVVGFYLVDRSPETPDADTLFVVGNGYNANTDRKFSFYKPTSIVIAYDISVPATPKKLWDFSIDGYLNASRSAHKHIYLVTQFSMWPFNFMLGATNSTDIANNVKLIDTLSINDILPKAMINNVTQPLVTAQDCFVPTTRSNSNIFTGSLMTLIALPFDDPTQATALCTTENTNTVYSSTTSLYTVTNEYQYFPDPVRSHSETNTVVHRFDYTNTGFAYQASGRVSGWMGWVSAAFRLHEKNGVFSIFTSTGWGNDRVNQLHILEPSTQNSGELIEIANLPNKAHPEPIGKTGEDIHGVRFNGDYAYVVTFRNTDPLYAVNLANPREPFIEGALEIPGYSDYLHPIGDNYLLGVGKDAIVKNGVAYYQGVKVGLFDVTDKSKPVLLSDVAIGKRGSDAIVTSDYKSFAIVQDMQNAKYRIMLPVHVAGENYKPDPNNPPDVSTYYQWSYNGAHLFELNTATETTPSLKQTGILKSTVLSNTLSYDDNADARALIVGDHVHYIQQGKVWSATWTAPQNAVGPQ